MPESPRFSVTVPAYNAQHTLAETIESVRCQDFQDWELVIVDDGSTDETLDIASHYAETDPRISVISQVNRGSGGAYNTAVLHAQADLLVMLSADDLLASRHLQEMARFIDDNPAASIFTCDGWYEYPHDVLVHVNASATWASPDRITMAELLRACFFGVGAVYRREVYDAVGGFNEDLYAEDYLFWLLALAKGFEHRHLNDRLAVHRRDATQKSADAIAMRRTDIRVLQEVIASDLLGDDDLEVVLRVIARHRRNVRIRRVLGTLMGEKLSTGLIDRMAGRGPSSGGDT